MGRFFIFVGIVIAAAVLFVVIATSGGSSTDPGSTPGQGKKSAPKILNLALDTDPKSLDPIGITDTLSDGVARKIHNALVRFKRGENGVLTVAPDLAEKWDVSPDGKLYTFTLRKGVNFHNGREVKAADAVYSLMRLLSIESKRPDWLRPMVVGSEERYKSQSPKSPVGIKATGEYTMTIELTAPFAPFIQHLCTVNCSIVPKEAVEDESKPFARNPVGVGAFKFESWENNLAVTLTRNDSYYGGKPKLDAIKFFIIKDRNMRVERYFAGELDATDIPYGRMKETLEKAKIENTLTYDTFRTNYIGLGFPNGDFKKKTQDLSPFGTNKLVRQAMNYAIDREYLCDKVLEGRGTPAKGILPPGMLAFKADRKGWPKDVKKAKELLAQAGFPDGKGLPVLVILHRNDENTKLVGQALAHDLDEVGIKTELQARDWNMFLEMVEIEPRQCFLLGWVADYPDPDNFLYVLFHSKQWGAPGNHTWYVNTEVDALTEKARGIVDMAQRIPLYQKAEDIILEDSPWICTYNVRNVVLLRSNIKGIRENWTPLDTGTEFPQVDFAIVDKE